MKDIIILIVLTAIVLYIFQLSDYKKNEENKFKKYFNQSKTYIFILCMLILSYNISSSSNVTSDTTSKIPDVYTENFKF